MMQGELLEIDDFVAITDNGVVPVRLTIVHDSSGFLLISNSSTGGASFNGDTWHSSLTEAFAQAKFQFGVSQDRWRAAAT